jgi:serine/threonine protein kinase
MLLRVTVLICEPQGDSDSFKQAYYKSSDKKELGSGGFGTVKSFRFNEHDYAVKEITLKPSTKTKEIIAGLGKHSKENFDKFRLTLEYNLSQGKITEREEIKYESDINKLYHKDIINEYNALLDEVTFSKSVSDNMINNQGNTFKYHLCIKVTGFFYLVFYDKYGEALNSQESRKFFSSTSIHRRIKIYLKITWAVLNLHRISVFQCDLKPSNIVWKNEIGGDIVIIDYGFGSTKNCQKSTKGFNAPELFKEINKNRAPGLKTEIYSIAMILADIEFRAIHKSLNLVAEQIKYEIDGSFLNAHHKIPILLKEYEIIEFVVYSNENKNREENYKDLISNFGSCLYHMMNPDPAMRMELKYTYLDLWKIYQKSKYFDADYNLEYNPASQRIQKIVSNAKNRLQNSRFDDEKSSRLLLDDLHLDRDRNLKFFEDRFKYIDV